MRLIKFGPGGRLRMELLYGDQWHLDYRKTIFHPCSLNEKRLAGKVYVQVTTLPSDTDSFLSATTFHFSGSPSQFGFNSQFDSPPFWRTSTSSSPDHLLTRWILVVTDFNPSPLSPHIRPIFQMEKHCYHLDFHDIESEKLAFLRRNQRQKVHFIFQSKSTLAVIGTSFLYSLFIFALLIVTFDFQISDGKVKKKNTESNNEFMLALASCL